MLSRLCCTIHYQTQRIWKILLSWVWRSSFEATPRRGHDESSSIPVASFSGSGGYVHFYFETVDPCEWFCDVRPLNAGCRGGSHSYSLLSCTCYRNTTVEEICAAFSLSKPFPVYCGSPDGCARVSSGRHSALGNGACERHLICRSPAALAHCLDKQKKKTKWSSWAECRERCVGSPGPSVWHQVARAREERWRRLVSATLHPCLVKEFKT